MAGKVKLAILHLFSYEIRNEKLTSHSIVTKPKITISSYLVFGPKVI